MNVIVGEDNGEHVKIAIQGNDKELVDLVEKKLHIQKREYKLEKKMVKFLIGLKGDRIKQIIENSRLIKIDFDNAVNSGSKDQKVC